MARQRQGSVRTERRGAPRYTATLLWCEVREYLNDINNQQFFWPGASASAWPGAQCDTADQGERHATQ